MLLPALTLLALSRANSAYIPIHDLFIQSVSGNPKYLYGTYRLGFKSNAGSANVSVYFANYAVGSSSRLDPGAIWQKVQQGDVHLDPKLDPPGDVNHEGSEFPFHVPVPHGCESQGTLLVRVNGGNANGYSEDSFVAATYQVVALTGDNEARLRYFQSLKKLGRKSSNRRKADGPWHIESDTVIPIDVYREGWLPPTNPHKITLPKSADWHPQGFGSTGNSEFGNANTVPQGGLWNSISNLHEDHGAAFTHKVEIDDSYSYFLVEQLGTTSCLFRLDPNQTTTWVSLSHDEWSGIIRKP